MSSSPYSRQTILEQVGPEGQAKISASKVLLVGAGGLGSPIAQYLAGAGIGQLTLIDDDEVDVTNLGRQILHGHADVGVAKVDSAKESLERINPHISIQTIRGRFREDNAKELVLEHDFVIDGADNFTTKFLINDSCVLHGRSFSHAGVLGWGGQTFTYSPGQPCYRCLFEEPPPPDMIPNCSEAGVMGPVVGLLGCVQATEAIKFILGMKEELLYGELLTVDALDMKFRKVKFPQNPDCPICGHSPRIKALKEEGVKHCDLKAAKETYLITFEGSQRVLKAERLLKKAQLEVEPRVTPRQLSSECGICLQLKGSESEKARSELEKANMSWVRFEKL